MSSSISEVFARLEKEGRTYRYPAVILAATEGELCEDWELRRIDDRTSIMVGRRAKPPVRD